MSHMVMYRNADGSPAYHQAELLDDAVRFVERLRNEDLVQDARIFRLTEVPIEFRAYYRVAVADDVAAPVETVAAPVDEAAVEAPLGEAFVEAPVAEAPFAEAPFAEAPVVDAPAVEAPVVDAPLVDSPLGEPVAANGSGRFGLFGRS